MLKSAHVTFMHRETTNIPVVGMLIVHPHEVFFEPVDLGFATDYPVVVHDHALDARFVRWKEPVSFLEVVQAAQVPGPTSTTHVPLLQTVESPVTMQTRGCS